MEVTKNDVTVVLPVLNEVEGVILVIDELVQHGYRNIVGYTGVGGLIQWNLSIQ